MKHIFWSGFLLLAFVGTLPALEARVGLVLALPGTFAADAVAEGGLELFNDSVKTELGLELGYTGSAARLLIPAGLAFEEYLEEGWSAGVALHGLAGADFGAAPTFLWGGEVEARAEYAWVPGVAVGLSASARYLGSAWEFPLHVVLEIPFGPEDQLEVVTERDSPKEEGH
jgi:hypothetical protein